MAHYFSITALAATLFLFTSNAEAQSWKHPPKPDFDDASEQYSEFWEQVLAGEEHGYAGLIARAIARWDEGGKEQRSLALSELQQATKRNPKKPGAFFWLGQFHLEARDWKQCAIALAPVFALAPDFKPSRTRQDTQLSLNLASCLLYSGDYEKAVWHFKRILSLSYGSAEVERRLGEALMALGRLDEAIDMLERAAVRSSRRENQYTLAVALDRAERIAESKKVLRAVVVRDHRLSTLRAAERVFAPASDEHYYLGLASAATLRKSQALYQFRRFLKAAPKSAWIGRAKAHRDALGEVPVADDLRITAGRIAITDLQTAIRTRQDQLRACLKNQPLLLLQIEMATLPGKATLQVRAMVQDQLEVSPEAQSTAVECVESVLRSVKVPKPSSARGDQVWAKFSLLGD